jgi:hypothetical protein
MAFNELVVELPCPFRVAFNMELHEEDLLHFVDD